MGFLQPVRRAFEDVAPYFRHDRLLSQTLKNNVDDPHAFSHVLNVEVFRGRVPSHKTFLQLQTLDRELGQNDSLNAALCRASLHEYLVTTNAWNMHLNHIGPSVRQHEINLILFAGHVQMQRASKGSIVNLHSRKPNVHLSVADLAKIAFSHEANAVCIKPCQTVIDINQALTRLSGYTSEMAAIMLEECTDRGLLKKRIIAASAATQPASL